jgi:hypothetical protein
MCSLEGAIGTEGLNEYYDFELGMAAHKFFTEIRLITSGQQVLFTQVTSSDARVIKAVIRAIFSIYKDNLSPHSVSE